MRRGNLFSNIILNLTIKKLHIGLSYLLPSSSFFLMNLLTSYVTEKRRECHIEIDKKR